MGGTRNLKLVAATWGKGQGTGDDGNRRVGPVGQMSTGLELPGGYGVEPPTPIFLSTYAHFEQKSALNFDPLAKFQTFRHLNVLEVSIIIICKLSSSHLDKCIVTLGHFSTSNISTGGQLGGKGTGGSCPLLHLAPPMAEIQC